MGDAARERGRKRRSWAAGLVLAAGLVALWIRWRPEAPPEAAGAEEAAPPAEPEAPDAFVAAGLPPRGSIAGWTGLRTRSTVLFEELPGTPHLLHVVLGFPARGVWRLEPLGGRQAQRVLIYRAGERVHVVPSEGGDSELLEGRDARIARLQMELRQAALLWPDGHPWTPARDPDRVSLGASGWLEAAGASGPGGRPAEFRSFLPDGERVEALTELRWTEGPGRVWPAGWTLETPAGIVWRESIESVEPGGVYDDRYFFPPDRLGGRERELLDEFGEPQLVTIPARVTRRFPLPSGSDWIEAIDAARGLLAREGARVPAGEALDPRAEIELDEGGKPRAVRLRLAGTPPSPPPGWERAEELAAASLLVGEPRWIDAETLDALAALLPPGAVPHPPYLRIDPSAPPGGMAQLVLSSVR